MLNLQNRSGQAPLIRAANSGRQEVVELLLKQKSIDLKSQDIWGDTALSNATKAYHTEIVELHLQHDLNLELKDATLKFTE